jgi:hypothetical protein
MLRAEYWRCSNSSTAPSRRELPSGARLNRLERWTLRIGFGLATASGLAYGYLRYFATVAGEFGPEPHPWRAFAQHAHVFTAPALLFALGVALRGHILGMLRHGVTKGRRTGLFLAALSAPIVLGGFAIQVVTNATTRSALGWTHSVLSMLFALLYGLHWAKPRSLDARPKRLSPSDLTRRPLA